jgi:hypothetical protein
MHQPERNTRPSLILFVLHRLLGKKILEAGILKKALDYATGSKKTAAAAAVAAEGQFPMEFVAEAIVLSRSNLAEHRQ